LFTFESAGNLGHAPTLGEFDREFVLAGLPRPLHAAGLASAPWGSVPELALAVLRNGFSFKPLDFLVKPQLECPFRLVGIQGGDSSATPIQRNMVTRDILAFARLRNVLHEHAFSAGASACRITEIQAGGRVLEGRCGFMWRANGAAVTAVLKEGQFESQFLQKFELLVGHLHLPRPGAGVRIVRARMKPFL